MPEDELAGRKPLEEIENAPVRLAGYNRTPDFGDDTIGNLHESGELFSSE